jgi:phosphoribosylaminoimidazolecarboxamide formyltransferase/IMP cyclohydrolase
LQTWTHVGASWLVNFGLPPFIAIGKKHGNDAGVGIGVGVGITKAATLEKMATGNTEAMFGGSVMVNFEITADDAEVLVSAGMRNGRIQKFDTVIAPGFGPGVTDLLARKGGKCRLVLNPALASVPMLDSAMRFRYVRGGFLLQPNYEMLLRKDDPDLRIFGPEPSEEVWKDIILLKAICDTSNSNTITIGKDGQLWGNAVGQQFRVGASELAVKLSIDSGHGKPVELLDVATNAVTKFMGGIRRMKRRYNPADLARVAVESALKAQYKNRLKNAIAVSDSFFPFPDAVLVLINAGIKTIFSTSGSIQDAVIQKLCVDKGITLVQLPDAKARGFFGH